MVLESTAARHLGAYGRSPDPTPNLTALAARSIVFERAYAVYPESIKGLFATLCSRYPAFDTPPEVHGRCALRGAAPTLAAAGYRTALFHSGRFAYLGMPAIIERRGFDLLEDAGAIGGQVNSSFGVDDASTVRRALQWIGSLGKGERFFLTYLPVAGHNPYEVSRPGPFKGTDDFTRYLNALHEGDEALGQLLAGLRALGIDDETLVIVYGDHGEAFGEHPGNFAHTMFIHEENLRVPYVIAAPGAVTRAAPHSARRQHHRHRADRARFAGPAGRGPAPGNVAPRPGAAHGAVLHRLLDRLARPGRRVLEIFVRDGFRSIAALRRLRRPG